MPAPALAQLRGPIAGKPQPAPRWVQHLSARTRTIVQSGNINSSGADGDASAAATPSSTGSAFDTALPTAFRALAATSGAFAAAAFAAPGPLLGAVVGAAGTPLEVTWLHIAGGTMAISAAVEWSLADAAANGRLGSSTYRRLMGAVAVKDVMYLLAFALSSAVWTVPLFVIYPTTPLASLAVCVTALSRNGGISGLLDGLTDRPKTSAGWVYIAFAVLYAATLAACYAPEALYTAPVTPTAQLLKLSWAGGFWLCAAACLVLRDAADRGRLGASTFKRLNLGLAAVEVVYAASYGGAILSGLAVGDSAAASNLVGSVGIAGYALYQYANAKK